MRIGQIGGSPSLYHTGLSFAGLCVLALLPFSFAACGGGKAEAKTSASADTDHGVNFDAESENAWDMEEGGSEYSEEEKHEAGVHAMEGDLKTSDPDALGVETALFGARHDLFLKSSGEAHCKCLSVGVGRPNSALFTWVAPVPRVDDDTQLVLALGSEGVSCDYEGAPASYAGFEKRDGNVVILVEEAVEGRPVTHGAIIPKPEKGHTIVFESLGKSPYGQSLDGQGACKL